MGNPILFAVLVALSMGVFVAGCASRIRLISLGTAAGDRIHPLATHLRHMLLYAFFQKRVISRAFGLNHFVIFWSFLVLMLANGEFVVNGVFPGIGFHLLPVELRGWLALLFDVVSLVTLAVIGLAVARRLFFPPDYLPARTRDAFIILGLIALLMVAFFGTHASEIAAGALDPKVAARMPVSAALASLFGGVLGEGTVAFFWWAHAVVLLSFLNYLPYSKHMHILAAIPNCFLRNLQKANTLPRETFEPDQVFGAGRVDRLSWKDLLDSFACTECGRCTDVCPAYRTDKPLNPRLVVHDVKVNLLANGARLRRGEEPALPLIGEGKETQEGSVAENAIWSCTTCGACMEVCPVLIEQMPKILHMRRDLVEMRSKFPDELLNLFENIEQRSNPWGIAPTERTKWCSGIQAKPFSEETEYLFFVGCAGSFDSRTKHVSLALTRILDAAGVSWGILGRDELCCGESLRRLGNEYLFDRLARQNMQLFRDRGVRKIITLCPHCLSVFRNDYRAYGADFEVIHHSELIDRLIQEGRLPQRAVDRFGRLVFHDSCYLGRHNDIYEPPRRALRAATGSDPLEMKRCRANSFCCGAGGGGMWMEERQGTRINVARVTEALAEDPQTVCVTCPYCLVMFEDGLKDKEADQRVRVKDIAEIVADAMPAAAASTPAGAQK